MAYNLELTWHGPRCCWSKFYRGRRYYLGKGKCRGKTDMDGYRHALAEWEHRKGVIDWQGQNIVQTEISPQLPDVRYAVGYSLYDPARCGLPQVAKVCSPTEFRLKELKNIYLAGHQARVSAKNLSVGEYDVYRCMTDDFVIFATEKATKPVTYSNEITLQLLEEYRYWQMHFISLPDDHEDHKGPRTAKARLAKTKLFMEWMEQHKKLSGVFKLDKYANIRIPMPEIKFYSVDDIRNIWNAATDRTKLYIALALNCGYTQIDIASLEYKDLNTTDWIIKRVRHKRKHDFNQRQIHKLWNVTTVMLLDHIESNGSGLILRTKSGGELQSTGIDDKGRGTKSDPIKNAFDRTKAKAGMKNDGRTFKHLRKSAANEIAKKFPPYVVKAFLAHSDSSATEYYVTEHDEKLFEAIKYIEQLYDLRI